MISSGKCYSGKQRVRKLPSTVNRTAINKRFVIEPACGDSGEQYSTNISVKSRDIAWTGPGGNSSTSLFWHDIFFIKSKLVAETQRSGARPPGIVPQLRI